MEKTSTCTMTRLRRILLLLAALSISSCNSFASVNVATSSSLQHQHVVPLSLSKRPAEDRVVKPPKKKKKTAKDGLLEYELRKQQWLDRYGSVQALRATFGTSQGDLTPEQTRRLYHTLLPRSLLGLYEMGLMKPEELAPLAYEARIAAKQYARSRCVWYARVATQLFDQYRNLRDRGSINKSVSWDELWSKYEAQIVKEECEAALAAGKKGCKPPRDLTLQIYLRILEKSTATNKAFDQMFLNNNNSASATKTDEELHRLAQMGQQLDEDVRTILLGPKDSAKALKQAAKLEIKQLKEHLKREEKEQKMEKKLEKKRLRELAKQQDEEEERLAQEQKRAEKRLKQVLKKREEEETEGGIIEMVQEQEKIESAPEPAKTMDVQRYEVLKIMAGTRRKLDIEREQ